MNNLFKKTLLAELFLTLFATPFALALTLPKVPLIAGSSVEPNMMMLLDSSGSMKNIVVEETEYAEGYSGPYDQGYSSDYTYTCDSGHVFSGNVYLKVADYGNGTAYFSKDRDYTDLTGSGGWKKNYQFGNSGSDKKCFDNDTNYTASLYAFTGSSVRHPANNGTASYTGHYLNWYFNSATGGFTGGQKDNTFTRMQVTHTVASSLVGDLDDIRVGLAKYNGSDGAKVLVDIASVETQRSTLTTQINNITHSGNTPLVESLQDLGWYYRAGYTGNLTLHAGGVGGTEVVDSANDIFTPHGSNTTTPGSGTTVIQNWCQQNFIVAMTDGQPTSDGDISSRLQNYSTAENGVDVVQAMYETDLRPDIDHDNGDEYTNKVETYLIGFGGAVSGSTLLTNMATAGGTSFYTASSSAGLIDVFNDVVQNIAAKTSAMSSVSFNANDLSTGTALYTATFDTSWSSTFSSYSVSEAGVVSSTANWDAAEKLDTLFNPWVSAGPTNIEVTGEDDISDRNIFTYNSDADTRSGVVFSYANFANLSDAQKADLYKGSDADGDGNSTDDNDDAEALINYIYGDNDNNVGTSATNYRSRSSRLGDIVNSTSVYVEAPTLNWPDYSTNNKFGTSAKSYSEFKNVTAANRTPMTYVGANDGMLHGFNAELTGADAGQEKLAYIPGIIASNADDAGMHYLASQNYAHQFYVDLTPIVSDVFIDKDGVAANRDWHSVLIGGLRAGGKGIFALDITDPSQFTSSAENAEDLVLWEFSSADDADFGYSYSRPTVAMMSNGKWAVITGNGYKSTDEKASLFILFVEEGADGTWDTGDYIKIPTNNQTSNGLSTPKVVDLNQDGVADYIYAGDLQGNMWAFDVTDTTDTANWKVSYGTSSDPKPLFTANNGSKNQPITSAPKVVKNTYTSGGSPNLLVFFGTGQYLETNDVTSNLDVMSYYGVQDNGGGDKSRSDLTSRTLITKAATASTGRTRSLTGSNWNGSSGWYFDLVDRATTTSTAIELGERVFTDSTIENEILYMYTNTPSGSVCSSGGTSWTLTIDFKTGQQASYNTLDVDGDGVVTAGSDGDSSMGVENTTGLKVNEGGPVIIDNNIFGVSTAPEVERLATENGGSSDVGRFSWEEMIR